MVTRIGGLASGMDIDSMVEQLMQAERKPLDKINQRKTYTEWQRDDYRSMNSLLLELDQQIFNGVAKQGSYIKKTVNISDPNVVSIKNINSTIDFTGSLEVTKLATAATMSSTTDIAKSSDILGIGAQTVKISAITKDGTMQDTTISITNDDTLDSVIAKINKDSGVTAFFDETSKRISFTAKNAGDTTGSEIKLTDDSGITNPDDRFFSGLLNLELESDMAAVGKKGTNAELIYNGMSITRTSNTFQINGVEFTAKKETTGTPVTFSSTADVDAIMDTIVKFVDKYNEVIDKIKTKTSESKYRAYTPLTTAQKKEMEEDEIKLWEEKAKSGTLRNDSILSGILTKMRSDISDSVSGTSGFKQLSQIGITTTKNYLDGGKLTIEEDKLRAAIAENPNAIYELFQKSGETTSEKGIAQRLRASLKTAMTDITEKAGNASKGNNSFTLGKLLNNYNDQISSYEDKLKTIENRYWSKFSVMETAINRANSQSAQLTNMFNSQ
ncbi:flagellar hook-associated protein 2 [Niallia sp. 03091]|uniref:flagellar hook-associated protein 2 n=1 Tax=unclassified Niallia TaxID=2837522 RepID=UPI004044A781